MAAKASIRLYWHAESVFPTPDGAVAQTYIAILSAGVAELDEPAVLRGFNKCGFTRSGIA
jgi:hypothetical protein